MNTLLTEFNSAYFKNVATENSQKTKLSKYIEFKVGVETHLTEQYSINTIVDYYIGTSKIVDPNELVFEKFPPTFILVGSNEILFDDAKIFMVI